MRALLTSTLVLPLIFGSGCFVFDEIDAGMKIMEAHTPAANKKKKEEEAAAEAGEKPPTYNQAVHSWWKDAGSLSPNTDDPEAAGDANAMVTCHHEGKTFFARRSDCLARGGKTG